MTRSRPYSSFPFDRAANRRLLISRRHTGSRNDTHGLDKLSGRPCAGRSCTSFVEPAAVLELAIGVVTEEVRRTDRPIRPRYCLGLIMEVPRAKSPAIFRTFLKPMRALCRLCTSLLPARRVSPVSAVCTITLPLAQLSQPLPIYFRDWSRLISDSGVRRCMFKSGDVGCAQSRKRDWPQHLRFRAVMLDT